MERANLQATVFFLGFFLIFSAGGKAAGQDPADKQTAASDRPRVMQKVLPEAAAAALFEQAGKLAGKDPREAIRLYRQGLDLKRDAWDARQQLAGLYEGQGQIAAALEEYRQISSAQGTKESSADLVRLMVRNGNLTDAALSAEGAAGKYPEDGAMQLAAGERLIAIGQGRRALPYLEKALGLKADVPRVQAALGRAYELEGRLAEAMEAYQAALAKEGKQPQAKEGWERLQSRAIALADFLLILPEGWSKSGSGLRNDTTGQAVTITVSEKGTPRQEAMRLARGPIPEGLFEDTAGQEAMIDDFVKAEKDTTGKAVSREEIRKRLGLDALPRYRMTAEELKGKPPRSLACVNVKPGAMPGNDKEIQRCALTLSSQGRLVSFLLEGGGFSDADRTFLAGLADRLVAIQKGGKGR